MSMVVSRHLGITKAIGPAYSIMTRAQCAHFEAEYDSTEAPKGDDCSLFDYPINAGYY